MIFAVSCSSELETADFQSLELKVTPSAPTLATEVPGVAMVQLSDALAMSIEKSDGTVPVEFSDCGVQSLERLFPDAGEFEARTREAGLHKWYRLSFDESIPLTKAGKSISDIPGVELFETQAVLRPASLPFNDPYLPYQWHYYNDGTHDNWLAGADINVFPIWERITTGDPSVVVAIVDGGVDPNHEDLKENLDLSNSYNFVSRNTRITAHDHGTHVAGTVAAVNNNGKGVCGVAGGDAAAHKKGVTLISCQIFQSNGSGKDNSAEGSTAIKWAADHGAIICQCSWGYEYESEASARAATTHTYIKEAIDYFNTYAGKDKDGRQVAPMSGGVVFFAAGNNGWAYAHPSDYEGCLAVGSFAVNGAKASYSNYGDWVDLAAPGGDQYYGEWLERNVFYSSMIASTVPGSKYSSYPYVGTSMACPHASGVAALLVSFYGGPGFTREDLIERMLKGAREGVLKDNSIGPKLDAWGSFALNNDPPRADKELGNCSIGKPGSVFRLDLDDFFSDPEGKDLTFTAESEDEDFADVEIDGSILEVYPHRYGNVDITVKVSDGFSEVSDSFTAIIRDNSVPVDLYPNPVAGSLYLRTQSSCEADVKVLSNSGAELISVHRSISAMGCDPIPVGRLSSGVYTVSIKLDSGRKFVLSFVKI